MAEALIIDAVRTPRGIGKAGKGALSDIHPQQLGATVLKALAERNKLNTGDIDDIIWGTSAQVGPQSGDIGRMSALDAGYDIRASGVTLDRFCACGTHSRTRASAPMRWQRSKASAARTPIALRSRASNALRTPSITAISRR